MHAPHGLRFFLEAGGKRLLRVTDNGLGMTAEELPLALGASCDFLSWRSDDLDEIRFLGFRGEALAAIASASRLRVASRSGQEADPWLADHLRWWAGG